MAEAESKSKKSVLLERLAWAPINNDVLKFDTRVILNPKRVLLVTWAFILVALIVAITSFVLEKNTVLVESKAYSAFSTGAGVDAARADGMTGCITPIYTNSEAVNLMTHWRREIEAVGMANYAVVLPTGMPYECLFYPFNSNGLALPDADWSVASFRGFSDPLQLPVLFRGVVPTAASENAPNNALPRWTSSSRLIPGSLANAARAQLALNLDFGDGIAYPVGSRDCALSGGQRCISYGGGQLCCFLGNLNFSTRDQAQLWNVYPDITLSVTKRPTVDFFQLTMDDSNPVIRASFRFPMMEILNYSSSLNVDQSVVVKIEQIDLVSSTTARLQQLGPIYVVRTIRQLFPTITSIGQLEGHMLNVSGTDALSWGPYTLDALKATYNNMVWQNLERAQRCWRAAEFALTDRICFKQGPKSFLSAASVALALFLSLMGVVTIVSKLVSRQIQSGAPNTPKDTKDKEQDDEEGEFDIEMSSRRKVVSSSSETKTSSDDHEPLKADTGELAELDDAI